MHPNLQVENEETIEAQSARTEALLERIQQRFLFVPFNLLACVRDALVCAIARARPHRQYSAPYCPLLSHIQYPHPIPTPGARAGNNDTLSNKASGEE